MKKAISDQRSGSRTSSLENLATLLANYELYTNGEIAEVVKDIASRFGKGHAVQELAAMRDALQATQDEVRIEALLRALVYHPHANVIKTFNEIFPEIADALADAL